MPLPDYRDADIRSVLHPATNIAAHEGIGPLLLERGEGIYVFDDRGRRYIEGISGLWCTSLGFGNRELAEAAYTQLRELSFCHGVAHKSSKAIIELAERLKALAPVPISKVFFVSSGSEANETQLKFLWYYNNALGRPQKKKVIAHRSGYTA